jgi:hypothetical protein
MEFNLPRRDGSAHHSMENPAERAVESPRP